MSDANKFAGALLLALAAATAAGAAGTAAAAGAASEASLTALATGGSGQTPASMYTVAELPANVLYEPLPRTKSGKPLPVLVWGNGGCANIGSSAKNLLLEVASHGFFVIAIGVPGEWPPPKDSGALSSTAASQLVDAIDWVTAANARHGSAWYHHFDLQHIAVAGHSCGGLQALQAATDPRVTTAVILDSGVLLEPPPMAMPNVNTNDKSKLQDIHVPLLYIIGGPGDIAYKNAQDDYTRLAKVPVFMANKNVGHGGTFAQPNGGDWGRVTTAWLQWRLQDDASAAKLFVGAQCGLCVDAAWTVQKKGIDGAAAQ